MEGVPPDFWVLVSSAFISAIASGIVANEGRKLSRAARRRTEQTEGVITDAEDRSGEYPVVTFQPGYAPRRRDAISFTSELPLDGRAVGDRVEVFYEPDDPTNAELETAHHHVRRARILYALALALMIVVAGLGYMAAQDVGRDRDVLAFIAAVRAGDFESRARWTAPEAQLDEAFLEEVVASSAEVEVVDIVFIGVDHSCMRGRVLPGDVQLMISQVRIDGAWRVERAANRDAECERRLARGEGDDGD